MILTTKPLQIALPLAWLLNKLLVILQVLALTLSLCHQSDINALLFDS